MSEMQSYQLHWIYRRPVVTGLCVGGATTFFSNFIVGAFCGYFAILLLVSIKRGRLDPTYHSRHPSREDDWEKHWQFNPANPASITYDGHNYGMSTQIFTSRDDL